MTLVDTSVWIEVFRKSRPLDLESLVAFDDIVTCLPIVQEILQGFGDERTFRAARDSMFSFPIVEAPLGRPVFEHAVDLYRSARRSGVTIRSSIDCLIAACAIKHDLTILHRDRDYASLARVSPLQQRAAR
jgi:predicted nucleic acid-binding protein